LSLIGLSKARQLATEARLLRQRGIDPIAAKKTQRAAAVANAARAVTFRASAERYVSAHASGWKSPRTAAQWRQSIATYCKPILTLPVGMIDSAAILRCVEPHWKEKTETMTRVLSRIENILEAAKVSGFRTGDNPAAWVTIKHLLPPASKVAKVAHYAAVPIANMPQFMAMVRQTDGVAAQALEFTTLTATRTSEALGATWREIDLTTKAWTIPANRMKTGKEFRVPLSARAVAVLEAMPRTGDRVFPLGKNALLKLMRRLGRSETAHGMRSTFRDWCGENGFPRELAEAALAHQISDETEAAYNRTDLLERRRPLMEAWGAYCASPPHRATGAPIPKQSTA